MNEPPLPVPSPPEHVPISSPPPRPPFLPTGAIGEFDFFVLASQNLEEATIRLAELIESASALDFASRRAQALLTSTLVRVGAIVLVSSGVYYLLPGLDVYFVRYLIAPIVGAYCLSAAYSAFLLARSTSQLATLVRRKCSVAIDSVNAVARSAFPEDHRFFVDLPTSRSKTQRAASPPSSHEEAT